MTIGFLLFWSLENGKFEHYIAIYTIVFSIYAVNYGGSLNVWSHDGKKLNSHLFKEDSLRCVDKFSFDGGIWPLFLIIVFISILL